jgi:UDP-N-acetylmuramate dehydrogenase
MRWQPPLFRGKLAFKVPGASLTHLGVGGNLSLVAWPADLRGYLRLLRWANRTNMPWVVIGAGSNVLILDEGFHGLTLVTTRMVRVTRTPQGLTALAGTPTASLSRLACKAGMSGLEFASGLPGTVGGAVAMNARAYGGEMSLVVVGVVAADGLGRPLFLGRSSLHFGYKTSLFQEARLSLLQVHLRLGRSDPRKLLLRSRLLLQKRRDAHQFEHRSAGCFFRNPASPAPPAGKLLEEAGLRGYQLGGAQLSQAHANFLINLGGATLEEILALARFAVTRVLEETGTLLRPEVKFLGRDGWVEPLLTQNVVG